jgi:hypothetical protein
MQGFELPDTPWRCRSDTTQQGAPLFLRAPTSEPAPGQRKRLWEGQWGEGGKGRADYSCGGLPFSSESDYPSAVLAFLNADLHI